MEAEELCTLGKKREKAEKSPSTSLPMWMSEATGRIANPMTRLHNEILEYAKHIMPSTRELNLRERSVEIVRDVVKKLWKDAEVNVFGSYATGLSLFNSDIDVVVHAKGLNTRKVLFDILHNQLSEEKVVSSLEKILEAKVPILKLTIKETGIRMDITINIFDGLKSVRPIRRLVEVWPPLKWLVVVLKGFLRERGYNQTFTNGVGSFLLVVMVTGFLQHEKKLNPDRFACETLGELLIKFFKFYGLDFNYHELGISVLGSGFLYRKPLSDSGLSVESPEAIENDIGHPVRAFGMVASIFRNAYYYMNYHSPRLSDILHLTR